MVVWLVMIPLWWSGSVRPFASGDIPLSPKASRIARSLYSWVWVIVIINYVIVAVIAQVQLDWFSEFTR